ncbi:type II secretion system F family protein [Intrasporangium sp.]|uniref:type II secretion system F family protein n=1 Tax=Intrasporangium sp. TaxID=1925024 RepID=UPI0032215B3D
MSAAGVAVLVLLAVLVWPVRRVRTGALLRGRVGPDRVPAPEAAGVGTFWHQDPVELWRRRRRRGGDGSFERAVLALLDGAAASLHVGLTPARALEVAGATLPTESPAALGGLVRRAVQAAGEGLPVGCLWREAADRTGSVALHGVAAAWGLSEATGCPLAEAVDRAAAELRGTLAAQRKVRAAVAGPQATVTVLTVLPLTGPLFGLACGVSPADLYGNAVGAACLGTGVALIWLGRRWCRRLVRRAGHST